MTDYEVNTLAWFSHRCVYTLNKGLKERRKKFHFLNEIVPESYFPFPILVFVGGPQSFKSHFPSEKMEKSQSLLTMHVYKMILEILDFGFL